MIRCSKFIPIISILVLFICLIQSARASSLEKIDQFKTGKGIRIGMKKSDIFSILGKNFRESSFGGMEILCYGYKLGLKSTYENLFYYELIFSNDKLTEFSFGYAYPKFFLKIISAARLR